MTSPSKLELTVGECKALYKVMEHEYIPYENEEAHNVLRKIMKFAHSDELARRNRQTTQ